MSEQLPDGGSVPGLLGAVAERDGNLALDDSGRGQTQELQGGVIGPLEVVDDERGWCHRCNSEKNLRQRFVEAVTLVGRTPLVGVLGVGNVAQTGKKLRRHGNEFGIETSQDLFSPQATELR